MKKLLSFIIGLAFLACAYASSWAVTASMVVGNAAYSILPTDTWITTQTAFTASRTWTLPYAGGTCIGQNCAPPASQLTILDTATAFSVASPLVLAPQSGDTINGSSNSLTIPYGGARITIVPTSGSNWKIVVENTTGFGIGTNPTVWHSGNVGITAAATGTDATAVNTETYIVEVFIPLNSSLTGISWVGLASSTGNVQFCLADSTGAVIAAACTASTATTTTANYQQVPFVAPYVARGPGKYFILMQNSGSNHYRAHTVGNFGASKKTGETYGTFTAVTPPTTFTTAIAPIADTY